MGLLSPGGWVRDLGAITTSVGNVNGSRHGAAGMLEQQESFGCQASQLLPCPSMPQQVPQLGKPFLTTTPLYLARSSSLFKTQLRSHHVSEFFPNYSPQFIGCLLLCFHNALYLPLTLP